MKKIVVILLAVLVILSIFATGCGLGLWVSYPAPIKDVAIWADESLPPNYFLDVVCSFSSWDGYTSEYEVTRVSNTTIEVEVINGTFNPNCPVDSYIKHTIPLGSDFVPGVNYTVVVNNVTETFIA